MANIDIFLTELYIFLSNFVMTDVFALFEHFFPKKAPKLLKGVGSTQMPFINVIKNRLFPDELPFREEL